MDRSNPSNQRIIITHAVLAGLTPLIPLPIIDDLIMGYFHRRLVRKLASAHGLTLPPKVAGNLSASHDGGILWSCLTVAVVYPLKSVFRKLFYFLEWKRVIDLTSRTFHDGYLVDVALAEGWVAPDGPFRPQQVRRAIDEVCRNAPIKPIEAAVRIAFRQSRAALTGGARLLERQFKRMRGRPDERAIAEAVEAVEQEEEKALAGVIARMQGEIANVSAGHFETLRAELKRQLSLTEG